MHGRRNKKTIFCAAFFIFCILPPAFAVQTIKATTYYSAPNGDYRDIRVSGSLTVGGNMQAFAGTGNFSILNNGIDGWITAFPNASQGGRLTIANNFNVQNASNVSLFYVDNVNNRVGIGTTTPLTKLDVNGGEVNSIMLQGYTDPVNANRDNGAVVEIFANDQNSDNRVNGFAAVSGVNNSHFIFMYLDAFPLVFQSVAKNGSFTGPVTMNLDPPISTTPGDTVDHLLNDTVNGARLIVGGPNVTAPPYGQRKACALSWTWNSSQSFKTDIRSFSQFEYKQNLDDLMQTPVYRYCFKNENKSEKSHIGFIAEESPIPIVTNDKKAINVGDTVGMLLAAVKSLKMENDDLKRRVEELKK